MCVFSIMFGFSGPSWRNAKLAENRSALRWLWVSKPLPPGKVETSFGAFCQGMLGLLLWPSSGFSIKPLNVELLAGEQKQPSSLASSS